jgi:quinol monooxygenase YgiN
MSQPTVSIHPYFKVHPGQLEAARALLPQFVARTATEGTKCRYYEFTINGDEVFCREAYADADGALAHMENVGALLDEMLKLSDLLRLEIHGPAAELEKLKGPLAELKPAWFAYACGVER